MIKRRIQKIEGDPSIVLTLHEMGFYSGAEIGIEVSNLREYASSDNEMIVVEINGSRWAIRKCEMDCIKLEET